MVAEDGAIILTGSTNDTFAGSCTYSYDGLAVKLDPDGTEVWRWQVRRLGVDWWVYISGHDEFLARLEDDHLGPPID